MSVPYVSAIPFAVLGASLLGSGHCIAMCGGLILSVAQSRKAVMSYHLGRLLGYCGLGGIAGFFGETVFQSSQFWMIPWFSTLILAFSFIFLGVRLWRGKSLHFFNLPRSFWQKFTGYGPGTTGLLSAFLPCGWLHVFILGAVSTQSAGLGAVYLFFFWLGTLPALSIAPLSITKVLQPLARRAPKASALILIAIGVFSLGLKMVPPSPTHGSCHGHSMNEK